MEQLVSLILSTIHPDVWMQGGGQASIGVFKTKLVIKAPDAVHKEVASLLEMLPLNSAERVDMLLGLCNNLNMAGQARKIAEV